MTTLLSDLFNYLQNDSEAPGLIFAIASFGVPLSSFILYVLFCILFPKVKVSDAVSYSLAGLAIGYTLMGFITQSLLFFMGVSAIKMALIWITMILVYGFFALFNYKMIAKVCSFLQDKEVI
ncbi:hypothetical protein HQ47_09145 [Porphyromonas macacae]|uniref:Uncharacterized protein n=1 Tax=Porphyromonas macacae TaxID=28115 RepID=A0A0A2E5V1_9PORP|nr:hypothetical protein [Porphyromonas macacae]KGN73012.1 hypothetical protein HQ47_09145 [Porphyromonas macacae]